MKGIFEVFITVVILTVMVVGVVVCGSRSEKFIVPFGTDNSIDLSVYEIKDPNRYIGTRVFKPSANKASSLFGNFEKNEKLPNGGLINSCQVRKRLVETNPLV